LYCAALPLAPPPFPTRRASDLQLHTEQLHRGHERLEEAGGERLGASREGLVRGRGHHDRPPVGCSGRSVRPRRSARKTCATDAADRKSTRLNSSHVKISYAVVC